VGQSRGERGRGKEVRRGSSDRFIGREKGAERPAVEGAELGGGRP
jgi:hypothetical protein